MTWNAENQSYGTLCRLDLNIIASLLVYVGQYLLNFNLALLIFFDLIL